jgi:hypothetical protein
MVTGGWFISQVRGSPIVGSQRMLIQYTATYPRLETDPSIHNRRTRPCHGDRDPLDISIRGYIQKFPDRPAEARTANGTALCHQLQLYHYFVSQSSEFCRHNPVWCFSTCVYCCCLFFYVRNLLVTPSYSVHFQKCGIFAPPPHTHTP